MSDGTTINCTLLLGAKQGEDKMNVYKVEIMVIDFDGIGGDGVKDEIENARYGNRCIRPEVKSVEEQDIGEWDDDHPLNQMDSSDAEYRRLFAPNKQLTSLSLYSTYAAHSCWAVPIPTGAQNTTRILRLGEATGAQNTTRRRITTTGE